MRLRRGRTALAILAPLVGVAGLAPSAEARKLTCEPGYQWTTVYMRYATKQTVKFTNTTTAPISESYRTRGGKTPMTVSRRVLNIDAPGNSQGILDSFYAQYGYEFTFPGHVVLDVPGDVLRGVRIPPKRRVIMRERVRFWRMTGQYLVTPDDPKFGATSKPVPGLPPGCALRTVGVITAAAPIDAAEPQRVVQRLKKKS